MSWNCPVCKNAKTCDIGPPILSAHHRLTCDHCQTIFNNFEYDRHVLRNLGGCPNPSCGSKAVAAEDLDTGRVDLHTLALDLVKKSHLQSRQELAEYLLSKYKIYHISDPEPDPTS